ncbi:hypothetical protein HDU77_008897 [Chytriomyces hyalinus]|nr:hypothetical protein HDU77_008897 [Chytriomyces hyalinus]
MTQKYVEQQQDAANANAGSSSMSSTEPPPQYTEITEAVVPAGVAISHAKIDGRETVLVSVKPPQVRAVSRAPVRIVAIVDLRFVIPAASLKLFLQFKTFLQHLNDNSGSMDDTVSVPSAAGTRESDGLTLLDIVKHAVKTIIASLTDGDHLAIVSFSDDAVIELPMTRIQSGEDESGRKKAMDVVSGLETTGSTNIWAGLDMALDVVAKSSGVGGSPAAVTACLLFTDGQPNIRPPSGELTMLQKRKQKKFGGELPCIINTFGFGYNLDSDLLSRLAECGSGSFAFIPDAGFVGTVFVDAACTILASRLQRVTVKMTALNGAQLVLQKDNTELFGGHKIIVPSTGDATRFGRSTDASALSTNSVTVAIGSVQSVQSKDFILTLRNMPSSSGAEYLKVEVAYLPVGVGSGDGSIVELGAETMKSRGGGDESVDRVAANWVRLNVCQKVMEAYDCAMLQDFDKAAEIVKNLISEMKKVFAKLGPGEERNRMKELAVDVEGQVVEALTKPYFQKWGKHYLLSLMSAHRLQQCNNFKDPGVQVYTSPLFDDLRDDINEIFLKLPAPKPSSRRGFMFGSLPNQNAQGAASAPVDMTRYNDPHGVCFAGSCNVTLADGTTQVTVDSLKKGDAIMTGGNATGRVHCLVRTRLVGDKKTTTRLVRLQESGLIITAYHPIRLSSSSGATTWMFPCNAPNVAEFDNSNGSVSDIYSIVLEEERVAGDTTARSHSIFVNGVECAALGHSMGDLVKGEEAAVLGHAYFGCRERVLRDLQSASGYEDGVVECRGVMRVSGGASGDVVCNMVLA